MLTLEHFKLLAAKPARIDRGSGGTPDITFQEVADALSRLSSMASKFARLKYANDRSLTKPMRQELMLAALEYEKVHTAKQGFHEKKKRFRGVEFWDGVIDLALEFVVDGKTFGVGDKCKRTGRRRWSKPDEDDFMFVVDVLDQADHELRSTLRDWNDEQANT